MYVHMILQLLVDIKWLRHIWLIIQLNDSVKAIALNNKPYLFRREWQDEYEKSDDSRNIPVPEVNIIHRKDTTIEEYRVNGRLRYVKITPKIGKPYYLVDRDGDGELETRHSDLDGIPPINEWILLEW